ncbi:MAG: LuxR family transcriptional regulator, partial [Planctomycetes bacterium]|nr:LuxR family transcriptional regulator [Planctomycetota bacterium]
EEKIQLNVKQMVTPFIERFRRSELDRDLIVSLDLMESSLHEILSPFIRSLSTKYLTLTFTEIQVANLIREGKTSKEIADLLHMSERTIEAHRYHIRKKLGLRNKNANLRVHLLSLA